MMCYSCAKRFSSLKVFSEMWGTCLSRSAAAPARGSCSWQFGCREMEGKKVKPQLCNVCFIQSKGLFTEKIPTHPEFR